LADSLRNLFAEVDAVWPNRDRRTDGWIGDREHQKRQSDHNPDSRGIVHAIDIDRDGIDTNYVVEQCISDDRPTNYVVWNRQIWSRSRDFRPRAYTGSNPHTDHIHVSILHGINWESNNWRWGIGAPGKGTGRAEKPGVALEFSDWRGLFDTTADVFGGLGDDLGQMTGALGYWMR
jgi:hypothetical protein